MFATHQHLYELRLSELHQCVSMYMKIRYVHIHKLMDDLNNIPEPHMNWDQQLDDSHPVATRLMIHSQTLLAFQEVAEFHRWWHSTGTNANQGKRQENLWMTNQVDSSLDRNNRLVLTWLKPCINFCTSV